MNNFPGAQQNASSNFLPGAQTTQNFNASNNNNLSSPTTHTLKPFPQANPSAQTFNVTVGTRINDVIEKAADYSTIIIGQGKYFESIRVTKPLFFQANGKVSLRSEGANECIIVQSPYVSFTGFSIKQKKSRIRGAVKIISGAVLFHNCVFKTLSMSTIQVQNDSLVQIKNCKVYGTKSSALQALNKSQIESIDTTFSNSTTSLINITNEAAGHFTNCTFNESRNGGITSSDSSFLAIENSTFTHCMAEFRANSTGCYINNCTLSNDSLIKTNNNCTNVVISRNNLSDSMIQIDGNSTATINSNRYNSSSIIVRGTSTAILENETFTGTVETSIRVIENAKFSIKNSTLSSITGYGIVAYGSSTLIVDNCQFINISNNSIISHSGCNVALSNLTFQNHKQTPIVFDSIIQAILSKIRIENCNGNGCEINGCQGIVKISECHFISNQKCGLVLTNNPNGVAVDENSTFTQNGFSGIYLTSSYLQLTNDLFQQNKKGDVYASSGSRAVVVGSTFTNSLNWASVYVDGQSQLQIDSSSFNRNKISIEIEGQAQITNSKFEFCQDGSALQITGKAVISGCEFNKNKCAIMTAGQASVTVEKSSFMSSETHIQTLNNSCCQCTECKFNKSTGDSAIRVTESSSLGLMKCEVKENSFVGIASDSNTSIYNSIISNSRRIGVLCNEGATGEIKQNQIIDSGESAILCLGGTPKIVENNIANNEKFGIYIASKKSPSVENNSFSSNRLAHIWHSE